MYLVVRLEKRNFNLGNQAIWSGGLFKSVIILQKYHEDIWSNPETGKPYIIDYDMTKTCPAGCEPDNVDLVKFLEDKGCPTNKEIILKIKGL